MGLYDRGYMKASSDEDRRSDFDTWEQEFSGQKKKTWVVIVAILLIIAFLLPEILFLLY